MTVDRMKYQTKIKIISICIIGFFIIQGNFTSIATHTLPNIKAEKSDTPLDNRDAFGVFIDCEIINGHVNINLAKELGSQVTRLLLPWWAVEPAENEFNFTLCDKLLTVHAQAGITPVVTLLCNSEWGTDPPGGPGIIGSSPPINMSQYVRFVQTVVERYKEIVSYWQIENEVIEGSPYWHGTNEEYGELLENASDAIKQVDPDALVVLQGIPCLYLKKISEGELNDQYYNYLMGNCSQFFDLIDIHYYQEPDIIYPVVQFLNETMNDYGYTKEIICTEAGDLDLGLFVKHLNHPDDPIPIIEELLDIPAVWDALTMILSGGVTNEELIWFSIFLKDHEEAGPILERYQAENLVKRVALILSQGVQQIHWLGIKANDQNPPDWFWPQMPLVDSDNRKKPHYYTYTLLIEKLQNFTEVQEINTSQGGSMIRFTCSQGNTIDVLWIENDEMIMDLAPYYSTSHVVITHIITERGETEDDAIIEMLPADSIPVTNTPIFIEETSEEDYRLLMSMNSNLDRYKFFLIRYIPSL